MKDGNADAPTVREGSGDRAPHVGTTLPAVPESATAFDPPPERFRTVGELGKGGMGLVVSAYDRALGRTVAVKSMLSTSAVDLARFEREAQVTARLEHPGIVPIYDAGRAEDGTPYYVMRKVDGRPLDRLVSKQRTLDERLGLVPNVLAVCDALAFAHAKQIIHRDLKPTNILVGPFGETLLIDWGLARTISEVDGETSIPLSDPNLTRAGSVAGTPGFMAPEQARGDRVDARSDVYALGSTLFYVLSGQLPYGTTSATEMIAHAGAERDPDWSRLPAEVPADLRAILVKAMAGRREDRYADAGEMAADLRHFVSGTLVAAHHYGWREQLARFVRRHRAVLAVGSIAVAVIAAIAALSVRRVVHERDDARHARSVADTQRAAAEDRGDELLVRHAYELGATDPAGAIAVLRRLRPESKQWRAAAFAAANAYARGVPRGLSVNDEVYVLELSPGPTQRLLAVTKSQHLITADLATLAKVDHGIRPSIQIAWLDDHTVALINPGVLTLYDIVTRSERTIPLPPGRFDARARVGGITLTGNGDVYLFDATATALPPPVLHDVSNVVPLPRGGIAVTQGDKTATYDATGLHPLPGDYGVSSGFMVASLDAIVLSTDHGDCLWRLTPTPVFSFCEKGLGYPLPLGERMLRWTANSFTVTDADGAHEMSRSRMTRLLVPTPHGYIAQHDDGSLTVNIDGEPIGIGAGPYGMARAQMSPDGRYAVTASLDGDLRVFDIDQIRPRRIDLGSSEQLVALTTSHLWTFDIFSGIVQYDATTGQRLRVFPAAFGVAGVSADGHWLIAANQQTGIMNLVDTTSDLVIPQRVGEILWLGEAGPFASASNGELSRLDATGRHPFATVPGEPSALHIGRSHIVVALVDHRLCRAALADGAVVCTLLARDPERAVADAAGVVWFLDENRVYRWDGTGTPQLVTTPGGMSDVFYAGGTAVAIGPTSVLRLDSLTPTAMPISAVSHASGLSDDRLGIITTNGHLGMIDLTTGQSVELPVIVDEPRVLTRENAVVTTAVFGQQHVALVYNFPVPTERAALRKWLDTITNATPVPGSDVVAWP